MGGCEDKTSPPKEAGAKRLVIRRNIFLGGLEVSN
jgi:hypothetical protein